MILSSTFRKWISCNSIALYFVWFFELCPLSFLFSWNSIGQGGGWGVEDTIFIICYCALLLQSSYIPFPCNLYTIFFKNRIQNCIQRNVLEQDIWNFILIEYIRKIMQSIWYPIIRYVLLFWLNSLFCPPPSILSYIDSLIDSFLSYKYNGDGMISMRFSSNRAPIININLYEFVLLSKLEMKLLKRSQFHVHFDCLLPRFIM